MKWISLLLATLFALLLSGCGHTTSPEIAFAPPKYVEELPSKDEDDSFFQMGSLFNQGKTPLFADRKAMSVNDLVTVVISENTSATSSSKKALSRKDNINLGGLTIGGNGSGSLIDNAAKEINQYTNIGAALASGSTFAGSGSQQRHETFTTTVSARVIKILNNGNYFIDGSREILIDGQKQIIRVNGVIRPEDISSTNSIDSQYIADAKILYETQGDISRSSKRKWGSDFIDAIWPF